MQIITIKQSLIPFRENLCIIGSFSPFFKRGELTLSTRIIWLGIWQHNPHLCPHGRDQLEVFLIENEMHSPRARL